MKNLKYSLERFAEKHPILLFAISVTLLLGGIASKKLIDIWLILHTPKDLEINFWMNMTCVMIFSGGILFPFGLVCVKKNRLFSEYWLALIAEITLFSVLLSLVDQPPYSDDPYYDQPVLLILHTASTVFLLASIVQGSLLAVAYCLFTDKEKRRRTIRRRILLCVIALLLSAFLIYCSYWLEHT